MIDSAGLAGLKIHIQSLATFMGVKKITICHKRNDCIGCGSCVLYAPNQWSMNTEDGKSELKDAQWKGDQFMVAKIDAEEAENNKKAAAACPVGIIRVD